MIFIYIYIYLYMLSVKNIQATDNTNGIFNQQESLKPEKEVLGGTAHVQEWNNNMEITLVHSYSKETIQNMSSTGQLK